jgi:hypothetical protein
MNNIDIISFQTDEDYSSYLKNIDGIVIPKSGGCLYHHMCEVIQILVNLSSKKLDIPIYTSKIYINSLYELFTTKQVLPLEDAPKNNIITIDASNVYPIKEHLKKIRDYFFNLFPIKYPPEDIVFIVRTHDRIISNIDSLKTIIKNIFNINPIIVIPENITFKEQVKTFQNAKLLIAAHGAALTNTLFMQENTNVLELYPPLCENLCYIRYISAIDKNINHVKQYHDIKLENILCYPEDLYEYLNIHKSRSSNPERCNLINKSILNCSFTDNKFKVDEKVFEENLKNIKNSIDTQIELLYD